MVYLIAWIVMSVVLFIMNYFLMDMELSHLANMYISISVSAMIIANELRRPKHKEYLRKKALYPKIPKEYLHDEPISSSVIFGRDYRSNKLVSAEIGHHTLIAGSTGSGKTACALLPSILACKTGSKQIVDIKSRELVYKSGDINDPKTMIIDFNRKDDYAWGWDIFYKLKRNGEDTEQEVLDTVLEVASIIVPRQTGSETFWSDAAKNELIGLMLYQFVYEKNYEFIDIIHSILNNPLREHMEKALNTVPKDSIVNSYLSSLASSAEETLFGVDLTLNQDLFQFVNGDVIYFLKGNKKRANPQMLNEDGITQYLCIDEAKLDSGYDRLFCIVMKQTLMELLSRTTSGEYPQTMLYYDEFQKLSESVSALRSTVASFLKTGRSKKTSLVLCCQNLDNFKKEEIYDILSNIHYFFILSSNNANSLTTEVVCKMAGNYYEKTQNYSEGKGTSISTSFQEKPILKPDDLNNLGKDAILIISNHGYVRTNKEATAYYKTEPFKSQYEKIIEVNQKVMVNA